jgi:hypothetical protein
VENKFFLSRFTSKHTESPQVNESEKAILTRFKDGFVKLTTKYPLCLGTEPGIMLDVLDNYDEMEQMSELFVNDAKAQGIVIPPKIFDNMVGDSSVGETKPSKFSIIDQVEE